MSGCAYSFLMPGKNDEDDMIQAVLIQFHLLQYKPDHGFRVASF